MRKFIIILSLYFMTAALCGQALGAGSGYAWSETSGWVNFGPTHGGVSAYDSYLTGYAWAENIGWVKLGSESGGPYANTDAANWGVNRSGTNLSGYAWSETAGWINFHPSHSQVTIDSATGGIDGYAWAENIGWIHFKNSNPAYGAVADIVSYTVTTTAINGIITSANNPTVNRGSTTTVTGSANANYYFTGVSGCGGIAQNNTNQSVTTFSYETGAITADCTVSATFTLNQYTITVTKAGTGSGTVNATGCTLNWAGSTGTCTASHSTLITLSGVANAGSTWAGWSNGTGSAGSCTGVGDCSFNITANSGVRATFTTASIPPEPPEPPPPSEIIYYYYDPAIHYTGGWMATTPEPCSYPVMAGHNIGGTNTSMSLNFTGTSIRWHTTTSPKGGWARVYIDGQFVGRVSLYSDIAQCDVEVFRYNLSSGNHTIKIVPEQSLPGIGINIYRFIVGLL